MNELLIGVGCILGSLFGVLFGLYFSLCFICWLGEVIDKKKWKHWWGN